MGSSNRSYGNDSRHDSRRERRRETRNGSLDRRETHRSRERRDYDYSQRRRDDRSPRRDAKSGTKEYDERRRHDPRSAERYGNSDRGTGERYSEARYPASRRERSREPVSRDTRRGGGSPVRGGRWEGDRMKPQRDASSPTPKRRHVSRKEDPVRCERLEEYPFLDPEKAVVLAGSSLAAYHKSLHNRLYLGCLGTQLTLDELQDALSTYGNVKNIGMAYENDDSEDTPQSKGYCFVDFDDPTPVARICHMKPGTFRIKGRIVKFMQPRMNAEAADSQRVMTYEDAVRLTQAGIIELTSTDAVSLGS